MFLYDIILKLKNRYILLFIQLQFSFLSHRHKNQLLYMLQNIIIIKQIRLKSSHFSNKNLLVIIYY